MRLAGRGCVMVATDSSHAAIRPSFSVGSPEQTFLTEANDNSLGVYELALANLPELQPALDRLGLPLAKRLAFASRAAFHGTTFQTELLASGEVSEQAFFAAMADEIGIECLTSIDPQRLADDRRGLLGAIPPHRPGNICQTVRGTGTPHGDCCAGPGGLAPAEAALPSQPGSPAAHQGGGTIATAGSLAGALSPDADAICGGQSPRQQARLFGTQRVLAVADLQPRHADGVVAFRRRHRADAGTFCPAPVAGFLFHRLLRIARHRRDRASARCADADLAAAFARPAGLFGAGCTLPRGRRGARPARRARHAAVAAQQDRDQAGVRGGRYRDHHGDQGPPFARLRRSRAGAAIAATHQAQGPVLCPAAGAR
ncbi:protein of unknown function [Aminobacter niigataensis]|nr:protein of unknown function [Aminobacter niigataensis]